MPISCPICSKENADTQEFCALCGTLLRTSAEPAKELSPEDVDAMLIGSSLANEGTELPVETRPDFDKLDLQTPFVPIETLRVDAGNVLAVEIEPGLDQPDQQKRVEPVEILPVDDENLFPVETGPGFDKLDRQDSVEQHAPLAVELPAALPPPKPTSRRWSPRCLGIGCLGVLLGLLVGVPLLYFFVIRLPIERSLVRQLEERAGQSFTVPVYSGGVQTSAISQSRANTLLAPLWEAKRGLNEGKITFRQDELVLNARWLFLPVDVYADLRVDSNGGLVVKSLKMNWAARLLFTPDSLSDAVKQYVNGQILRPKNIFLLGLQITDGGLFLAYRAR